jgi:uncharacterized protein YerC
LYQQGQSAYEISRQLGGKPTRQGIRKRAKREGWDRPVTGVVTLRHLTTDIANLGADTPENREKILHMLAQGATFSLAAGAVGISTKTLERWRKRDLEFGLKCRAVRQQALVRHVANIDRAGERDWKASKYILGVAPETRGEYAEAGRSGSDIVVHIGIDRDAVSSTELIIEHDDLEP